MSLRGDNILYVTQTADNLAKIKKGWSISSTELDKLVLEVNQLILIPQKQDDGVKLIEYYTEVSDTLMTIATNFKVNHEDIAYFNFVDNLYVVPNQSIQL